MDLSTPLAVPSLDTADAMPGAVSNFPDGENARTSINVGPTILVAGERMRIATGRGTGLTMLGLGVKLDVGLEEGTAPTDRLAVADGEGVPVAVGWMEGDASVTGSTMIGTAAREKVCRVSL